MMHKLLAPTPVPSGKAPVTTGAVGRWKSDCNHQKVGYGNNFCKQFAIALKRSITALAGHRHARLSD
jgi:hypothetical protein